MPRNNASTWRPVRRNKNIGTRSSGYKARNRFAIRRPIRDCGAFDEVVPGSAVEKAGEEFPGLTFVVQPLRAGFRHYVSISDIRGVLKCLPADDVTGVAWIVLRQPTRKADIFRPAWGRMFYPSACSRGASIMIDAQPMDHRFRLPRKMQPDWARELARLRSEGHAVRTDSRHYHVECSAKAIRTTQLYRTLAHEVGHWVDYKTRVFGPAAQGESFERLEELYFSTPAREREDAAERYADEMRKRLLPR